MWECNFDPDVIWKKKVNEVEVSRIELSYYVRLIQKYHNGLFEYPFLTFFCCWHSNGLERILLLILAAAVGDEGLTIRPPSVLLFLADADIGFSSVSTPMVFHHHLLHLWLDRGVIRIWCNLKPFFWSQEIHIFHSQQKLWNAVL